MNDYFQYVHNLKGESKYDSFKLATKNAIVSTFLRQIEDYNTLEKTILKEADEEVLQYISDYLDLKTCYKNIILTTDSSSYVEEVDFNDVHAIINLKRLNFIQRPNKLFRAVNVLLPNAGIYIGSVATIAERKFAIYRKFGRRIGLILWLADFLVNRVVPRIPFLERIYYRLTNGQFHSISKSEILGRLIYCGFEIIDVKTFKGLSYFVAIKVNEPLKATNPSFYPIVKLSRVGENGKTIGVYKFRTMHPYSEFLQDYVIRMNGYNDKGKPANDYRVTRWGSFMRRLWIDELPQLYNVLKGEMKLVGLRPLSQVRYKEFPEDLQLERIKYKPGCFPPYVALNMPDNIGNIEAERIYLRDLKQHPHLNDFRYFCKAVYNILANKIRSA